jgi:hypothetical protein
LLQLRTVDHDHLVVLEISHVLPLDASRASRRAQAFGRCGLGRVRRLVIARIVDNDRQPSSELLEPGDHLRFVEIVGNGVDLGRLVGDGLIEEPQDGATSLKSHPVQRDLRIRMGGREAQPGVGLSRQQLGDVAVLRETVDKGLRRNKPASESHVELTGIGLSSQLHGRLLRRTVAEYVVVIHEHRRDAVDEVAGQLGVEGEMNPAPFLDG